MKKTTISIMLVLSLLALLAGCNSAIASTTSGILTIQENNLDLKEIPVFGGKVAANFTIKNESSDPVTILKGETSCMCTEATIKGKEGYESPAIKMLSHGIQSRINYTLNPGDEAILEVVFDPLAHGPDATGPIRRDVYLETNSSQAPTLQFTFEGNVIKTT